MRVTLATPTWIALAWAGLLIALLGMGVPFGVPNEWVWEFRSDTRFDPLWVLTALALLLGLVGLVWWSGQLSNENENKHSPKWRYIVVGFLLLTVLLRLNFAVLLPKGYRPVPVFWTLVIASPVATSFYDEARNLSHQGVADYLRHYHERLPQKPFHAATHPPGLPLLFALWRWIALHPALQAMVPMSEQDLVLVREVYLRIAPPLSPDNVYPADEDFKAAWWIAVFCWILGTLATLLWGWLFARESGQAAFIALVATVPALLWWQTTVDSVHFFFVTATLAAAWLWHRTRNWGWALGTGMLAGMALWLAFKNAVPLACVALWLLWAHGRKQTQLPIPQVVAAALLTVAPYLLAWALFGFQPLETFKAANAAHHAQAGAHARSYLPWVFVNLADFAMALGSGWLGLCVVALGRWWREGRPATLMVATLLVLLALNLSGVVRGEVARLWLPFIPLLTWQAWQGVSLNRRDFALMVLLQGGLALALQINLDFLRPF